MNSNQSPVLSSRGSGTGRPSAGASLEDLYQRGEHYAVLNTALKHLETDPNNAEAAFCAVRSYIALGLIEPAVTMMSDGGGPLASLPEFHGLRDQIVQMPSGQIPWDSLRQRFEKNLWRLYETHPDLRRHDESFRSVPRALELYRTIDGNLQVSTRPSRGLRQWLPGLCCVKRLVANIKLPHDPKQPFCSPYLIACDHFGALLRRIHSGTQTMFMTFTPRIYLIEPDVRTFGATLYAAEAVDELCDPRTAILLGPECIDSLVEMLETDPRRAIPDYVVQSPCCDGAFHDKLVSAIQSVTENRQRKGHQTIAAMRRYYDRLPANHWRERFRRDDTRPLRILGVTSRFTTVLQYSMRALQGAFERLGHEFRLLIERNDHDLLPPIHIGETIEEFRPDLVVVIDHLRREYKQVIPPNVPFVCWIQDRMPHLFKKEAGRGVGPMEFVIGHGFPECLTEFDYPPDRFYPCVIPTAPDLLLDPGERPEDLEPYRCDVMYATNATSTPANDCSTPAELHQQYRQQFTGPAREFVDAAYEALMEVVRQPWFCGDYDYEGLIKRVEAENGVAVRDHGVRSDIVGMQRFIAHLYLREETIRAAARWADEAGGRFHLYGRGWQKRPEFARFARGVVEHGKPLGRAFRAAKISLHAGCNPALHQRVLDGLCAGGFFLIGEKPSDLQHDVTEAVYRLICEKKPALPFRLKPGYLPEPYASRCRRGMQMRGVDPEVGSLITEADVLCARAFCESRSLHRASSLWPNYERIVFRNAEHLPGRIDYFLADEDERQVLADEMRDAVLENFTYDALVRDVLAFVYRALACHSR